MKKNYQKLHTFKKKIKLLQHFFFKYIKCLKYLKKMFTNI